MRLFRLRRAGPTRKFSFHVEGIFSGLRGIRETLVDQFQRKYAVRRFVHRACRNDFSVYKKKKYTSFSIVFRSSQNGTTTRRDRSRKDSSSLSGKLESCVISVINRASVIKIIPPVIKLRYEPWTSVGTSLNNLFLCGIIRLDSVGKITTMFFNMIHPCIDIDWHD